MNIFDKLGKLRGNPIDKMKTSEIMGEEIRLKNHIGRIRKDINRIERDKRKKFQEGVGADLIKKKMLFQEIKQLDMEGKLHMNNFATMHKQYTFITNLQIIKKHEKQLKNTPIWDKLRKVDPSQLESVLIRMNLQNKTFEQMVDGLNDIIGTEIETSEEMEDPEEKKIMRLWGEVESGEKDYSEIEKEMDIKTEEEEYE